MVLPTEKKSLQFLQSEGRVSAYLNSIRGTKQLSMAQEKELSARIRNGDAKAMNALVEANLKFVVSVCMNYKNKGLPLGDLINEGNLGLIRAAYRFDASLNLKFISYAVWWIRQGILTALAEQSKVMRFSPARVIDLQVITKAIQKFAQRNCRMPRIEELAQDTRMDADEIQKYLQASATPVSLSNSSFGEEQGGLENILVDDNAVPPDRDSKNDLLKNRLESLIGGLDTRAKEILRLYYGVGQDTTFSLAQIGIRYGISRERVRQIIKESLRWLRHPSRAQSLKPMY